MAFHIILLCFLFAGTASAARRVPRQFDHAGFVHQFQPYFSPYAGGSLYHNYQTSSFASAACRLVPASGQQVSGDILFNQAVSDGPVEVTGTISGLSPGFHGFHIHQNGNVSDNCKAAGSHFNPGMKSHGAPQDPVRHVGDLGNIVADGNGFAGVHIVDSEITLDERNPRGIVGRAVVVHAKEDDLGKGNDAESLKTGNAGSRLACCVIETTA